MRRGRFEVCDLSIEPVPEGWSSPEDEAGRGKVKRCGRFQVKELDLEMNQHQCSNSSISLEPKRFVVRRKHGCAASLEAGALGRSTRTSENGMGLLEALRNQLEGLVRENHKLALENRKLARENARYKDLLSD